MNLSDLMKPFMYLEGLPFCIVYMKVLDLAAEKVELAAFHGLAQIHPDRLIVDNEKGHTVTVPQSALKSILPSDGTDILEDSKYYVIVKVGDQLPNS